MKKLEKLLRGEEFVAMAEIAPKITMSKEEVLAKAENLLGMVDVIIFSDQAGARQDFWSIRQLVESEVFTKLPKGRFFPVLATRRKSWDDLRDLRKKLKLQKVEAVFLVTGDKSEVKDSGITSLEAIPQFASDFLVGAVGQIEERDFARTLKKVKVGAKFLITQVCFDNVKWKRFVEWVKEEKLDKKVPIVPVVIPVVSNNMLGILQNVLKIPFSSGIKDKLRDLNDEMVRKMGVKLAREMIMGYKREGIFPGVYIYSKSSDLVRELV